jgi:hemerythrin
MNPMERFQWTDQYNTGISIIDMQHKELFRRIDNLTLSLYDGEGRTELKTLLGFLDSYVIEHFRTEEEYMQKSSFPGFEKHREKHQAFIELLSKIKQEFEKKGGGSYLAIRVEKEIRKWWEVHILKLDMEYIPYMTTI